MFGSVVRRKTLPSKKNMTAKLLADFLNNVFWTEEKKVEMFDHNA